METNKEAPQNGACKKVVGPRKEKRPSLGNPAAGSEISTQLEKNSNYSRDKPHFPEDVSRKGARKEKKVCDWV